MINARMMPPAGRVPASVWRDIRAIARVPQGEAARLAGAHRASWNRWERSGAGPDRWCTALGWALAYGGAPAVLVVLRAWSATEP